MPDKSAKLSDRPWLVADQGSRQVDRRTGDRALARCAYRHSFGVGQPCVARIRVCTGPNACPAALAPVALRRTALCLQLGAGAGSSRHRATCGRALLWRCRGRPDPARQLVSLRTPQTMERNQICSCPWWPENSKEAYASGLANLANALSRWSRARASSSNRTQRFPKFKSKRSRMSCRFSTGAFGLSATDQRHVRLPRIGAVRTLESTRALERRIRAGVARAPSQRWLRTRAEMARVHTRSTNARRDKLHQLTSRLIYSCESVVIEDLHVAGLIRNRRLSRKIQLAAWGALRRQLTYKAVRGELRRDVKQARWKPG